jgi:zinc-binding alcohol dehydrogenase family protein
VKAVGYRAKGTAEVLEDIELPMPVPGARDIVVAVKAVSVNPVDTKRRRWDNPPEGAEHMVLGYDAAGVVTAIGDAVTFFKPGDEVYYAGHFDRTGSNAEFQTVDERIVGHKPKSLNFAEAAALPLTTITAWEILFDRMKVPYGSKRPAGSLLVLNGAGGVGSIMIQLATRLTGLTVIATASRPETVAWVHKLGAVHVADHRRPIDEAIKAIGFDGVDYVAAITTTPENVPSVIRAMNPQGHINLIDDFEEDIGPFKPKSLTISWEMMFTRSLFETPDMIAQHNLLNEVAALIDAGVLKTTLTHVAGTINAANLGKVHDLVESGRAIGKTVLEGF